MLYWKGVAAESGVGEYQASRWKDRGVVSGGAGGMEEELEVRSSSLRLTGMAAAWSRVAATRLSGMERVGE